MQNEEKMPYEFRLIEGYSNYFVSRCGQVWSTKGRKPRRLKPGVNTVGYMQVVLSKDGKVKAKKVHRLVCEAYVQSIPKGMYCCHNDGDKLNNHASNLRVDTPAGNAADKVKHGTDNWAQGEDVSSAVLSKDEVLEICDLLDDSNLSQRQIAKRFGVARTNISKIHLGQTWNHLTNRREEAAAE